MKKLMLILVLSIGTLFTTNAIPITVISSPINITLDGINPVVATHQPGNYGDNAVFNWLTSDVITWNSLYHTSFPLPTRNLDGSPLFKLSFDDMYVFNLSIELSNVPYDYFVLHWGGQGGGWTQAYYRNKNLSGIFTFIPPYGGVNPYVGGLSFISYYGPSYREPSHNVPDSGSTMLLMGLALGCVGLGRKCLKS